MKRVIIFEETDEDLFKLYEKASDMREGLDEIWNLLKNLTEYGGHNGMTVKKDKLDTKTLEIIRDKIRMIITTNNLET